MNTYIIFTVYIIGCVISYYYILYDIKQISPIIKREFKVTAVVMSLLSWLMVLSVFTVRILKPNKRL